MGCNRNFSFPHWCTGFLAGASGLRKLARVLGRTRGRSALPGTLRCQRPPGLARPVLVIADVKGKAQTPKSFLLSLQLPPAGREPAFLILVWPRSCHGCLSTIVPQLTELLYLSGASPISTCVLLNKTCCSWLFCSPLCDLLSISRSASNLPLHSCKVKLILTLKTKTHSQWHHF